VFYYSDTIVLVLCSGVPSRILEGGSPEDAYRHISLTPKCWGTVVQSGGTDGDDEITGVRVPVSFRDQTCIDLGKCLSGSLTPVGIFYCRPSVRSFMKI